MLVRGEGGQSSMNKCCFHYDSLLSAYSQAFERNKNGRFQSLACTLCLAQSNWCLWWTYPVPGVVFPHNTRHGNLGGDWL